MVRRDKTHYDTLGVPVTATVKEIKNARAKLFVGELNLNRPGLSEAAYFWRQEQQKLVNAAVDTLRDPNKRREYDLAIGIREAEEPARSTTTADDGSQRPTKAGRATADAESGHLPFDPVWGQGQEIPTQEPVRPEPILPALGRLIWRLLRAGAQYLPVLIRNGPRIVLLGGLLIVGVIVSSFVLRQCGRVADESGFEVGLPKQVTRNCDSYLGRAEDLPRGAKAGLDCLVSGVSVSYFDFPSFDVASDYLDDRIARAKGVSRDPITAGPAGSCREPGHTAPYADKNSYRSPVGTVLCYVTTDGKVVFEWTYDGDGAYSYASGRKDYASMYSWWLKKAGPAAGYVGQGLPSKLK